MRRAAYAFCILFLLLTPSLVIADTAENRADTLVAEGKYGEGLSALFNALQQPDLNPEEKAQIHADLASFYDDLAGDSGMARNQWIQIRRLPLPAQHPMMVQAAEQLNALRIQKERFPEQAALLAEAANPTDDPVLLEQRITSLKSLIKNNPDFPDTARACYLLGHLLRETEQYWPAVRAYDKAVKLKPAIGLILPVQSARTIAFLEFKRQFVPKASWLLIGLIFFIALISALREKPHLNIGKSQRRMVVLMLVGWSVIFLVLTLILLITDLNREGIPYPKPTILKKLWYQPGGIRQLAILIYGLLIGTMTLLVAIATARWRSQILRNSVLLLVVAVLSLATTASHHMMFLSRDTEYLPDSATFYSLIYMNKHELPDSKEAILQMLNNASEKEQNRLMEYHIDDWDPERYSDKTVDDLAEMLLEKERAEK